MISRTGPAIAHNGPACAPPLWTRVRQTLPLGGGKICKDRRTLPAPTRCSAIPDGVSRASRAGPTFEGKDLPPMRATEFIKSLPELPQAVIPSVQPPAPAPEGLGPRALAVGLAELAKGVREQPLGSHAGPRIA